MREILEKLARGEISVEEAERRLKLLALEKVEELARLDIGRELRRGVPEIILADGKSEEDLIKIIEAALREADRVIVSRIGKEIAGRVAERLPRSYETSLHERAGILVVRRGGGAWRSGGRVGILAAGTADIPIAEEARIVAEEMGCEVYAAYDVGVAGIHRLFEPLRKMIESDVDAIVVVAGREGALPGIVAALVDVPVIGVPTSIGYGLGGGGRSALMSMLQSCSLGLAVVNIDGGVPAGVFAALIANRVARYRRKLEESTPRSLER